MTAIDDGWASTLSLMIGQPDMPEKYKDTLRSLRRDIAELITSTDRVSDPVEDVETNSLARAAAFAALPPDARGTIGDGEMERIVAAILAASPAQSDRSDCAPIALEKGKLDTSPAAMLTEMEADAIRPKDLDPAPQTKSVGPLVWDDAALWHTYGLIIRVAQTPFGAYQIIKGSQGRYEVYFGNVPFSGSMADREEAKAWAHEDYSRRIMSALATSAEGSAE